MYTRRRIICHCAKFQFFFLKLRPAADSALSVLDLNFEKYHEEELGSMSLPNKKGKFVIHAFKQSPVRYTDMVRFFNPTFRSVTILGRCRCIVPEPAVLAQERNDRWHKLEQKFDKIFQGDAVNLSYDQVYRYRSCFYSGPIKAAKMICVNREGYELVLHEQGEFLYNSTQSFLLKHAQNQREKIT